MYLVTCTQIYCVLGCMQIYCVLGCTQIKCPNFVLTHKFVVCREELGNSEAKCSVRKGSKTRLHGKRLYEWQSGEK